MTVLRLPCVAAQLAVTPINCPTCAHYMAETPRSLCSACGGSMYVTVVAVDADTVTKGDRVIIVAGEVDQGDVSPGGWVWEYNSSPFPLAIRKGTWGVPIFPGMVVGSAVVADALPIVDYRHWFNMEAHRIEVIQGTTFLRRGREVALDISDAAAFTDFTPGRVAVFLTDAAACDVRCPECDGGGWAWRDYWSQDSEPCLRSDGAGTCQPYEVES